MLKTLYKYKLMLLLAVAGVLCGCSDDSLGLLQDRPAENAIQVGGIATNELVVSAVSSRAVGVPAETVDWLMQPLKQGLDITYGLYNATPNHQDVAILKLSDTDGAGGNNYDTDGGYAVYTFKYRADRKSEVGVGNDAIWYNNGYHYFWGVHVPERIRYSTNVSEIGEPAKAPSITTDQHNDKADGSDAELGNYTLLSHYLGMPANFRLTATVERIKLPFRHRLARVVAFVLIDPVLSTTLKGYKKNEQGQPTDAEDPNTTSIRFNNVRVLEGVKDILETNGHHTLTPTWTEARKIIPHFDGERGSYNYKTQLQLDDDFKMYVGTKDGKTEELYPTSNNWKSYHDDSKHKGYTEINYGKVPVYDIIVRPTYTHADSVMYDEDLTNTSKAAIAKLTNKIDFQLELENGLRYEKRFQFDLDANYQTVVYLRISREHVDYNDAGSDLWVEEKHYDGWYGMDNENGNTLSLTGSSWQRAYTYLADNNLFDELTNKQEGVTDGHFYNASSSELEREHAQYFNTSYKDIWVRKFLEAYRGGKHHGDYFVLRNDIDIDARLIPDGFVFTGHLDGQDHTITLSHTGEKVYKEASDITAQLYTESDGEYSAWTIPTLYVKQVTPAVYYQASELTEVEGQTYVTTSLNFHPEVKYTAEEADAENQAHLVADEQGVEPGQEGYTTTYKEGYVVKHEGDTKTTAYYEVTESSIPATAGETIKEPEVITYPIATATTTPAYPTTLEQLKTLEYYTNDHSGTRFMCPLLYQFSHLSPAYLLSGLDGTYTTTQETAANPYAEGVVWEANVHREHNITTVWVPTLGYRAELMNLKMGGTDKLFMDDAVITGNVQNCWNGTKAIDNHTPAIPQYK